MQAELTIVKNEFCFPEMCYHFQSIEFCQMGAVDWFNDSISLVLLIYFSF